MKFLSLFLLGYILGFCSLIVLIKSTLSFKGNIKYIKIGLIPNAELVECIIDIIENIFDDPCFSSKIRNFANFLDRPPEEWIKFNLLSFMGLLNRFHYTLFFQVHPLGTAGHK